jgi:energy-coupling factor transporter transmembrane protein EcfT
MNKIISLIFLIFIILFFFNIFTYYLSNKNIKNINLNRSSIEEIVQKKIPDLPVLKNDTNDIIEFNSSFSEEIKNNEPRSFWDLLKSK